MSEIDKEKDIDQLMYRELPPDRYCYIHNYIVDLQNKLQQKENIIKEAIEYIDHCIFDYEEYSMVGEDFVIVKNMLQGSDKE